MFSLTIIPNKFGDYEGLNKKLMNTKKLITSTLIIFILYVLMDFLFYTFVFPEEYISKAARKEPLMQWAFLGLLIASFLFSYLFGEMA